MFDPTNNDKESVPRARIGEEDVKLNCSGHTHLSNGKLLFAGGGDDIPGVHVGHPYVFTFDPGNLSDPWERMDDMPIDPNDPNPQGRWYPTTTTLGSGKVLLIAGRETGGNDIPVWDDVPCIFNPSIAPGSGQWTRLLDGPLPNALKVVHFYPFMFQISTGKVFMGAGRFFSHNFGGRDPLIHRYTYRLDTALSKWDDDPIGLGPGHDFIKAAASAVMYRPDWVVKSGGRDNNVPHRNGFAIDLSASSPHWRQMNDMIKRRHFHELVALPDGRMLAMGGVDSDVANQSDPVLEPEWLDPTDTFSNVLTADWALLAPMDAANPRRKHSTTILLPDARLFVAGGEEPGQEPTILKTAQIFQPPYLFDMNGDPAVRPLIDSVPSVITYGDSFTITTSQAPDITKVCLIALGTTTHGFDRNQRYVPLAFIATQGEVQAAAPAQSNLAPPGYYMLFILEDGDRPGIEFPSEAEIVRLTFPAVPF